MRLMEKLVDFRRMVAAAITLVYTVWFLGNLFHCMTKLRVVVSNTKTNSMNVNLHKLQFRYSMDYDTMRKRYTGYLLYRVV